MAIIQAFRGIRPAHEYAAKVASPPYDVLNSQEARAIVADNPLSFLRIIKPEVNLPEDIGLYEEAVYQKGRENFETYLAEKILIQDDKPNLYLYEQAIEGHSQVGLVAASSVQDYEDDVIKKHEYTRPKKEKDRIKHMKTLGAQPGPVFLTYPDSNKINALVNYTIALSEPTYKFTTPDGVTHTFWVVDEEPTITKFCQLFETEVPATYIADGHHRAASAWNVRKALAEANGSHTGEEAYNFFLTVLFPASQVKIIDYNRLVKDLNGLSAKEFLSSLEEEFVVSAVVSSDSYYPRSTADFGVYLEGKWYSITAKEGTYDPNDPIGCLGASILQDNVLNKILGIENPRTDERIDFVGGIRGLGELMKRVDSGEMKVAFAVYPVSVEQLMDTANAGKVMPPKSTWFEPKLRSGLIVNRF